MPLDLGKIRERDVAWSPPEPTCKRCGLSRSHDTHLTLSECAAKRADVGLLDPCPWTPDHHAYAEPTGPREEDQVYFDRRALLSALSDATRERGAISARLKMAEEALEGIANVPAMSSTWSERQIKMAREALAQIKEG